MNLLDDHWLPICTRDGRHLSIAPWQLTEGLAGGDPPAVADAPRPDFNGALVQFLIGLLQTTLAPKDERAWEKQYREPPSPETLRAAFEPWREAFSLVGDGLLFMQDRGLDLTGLVPLEISALLIDSPAANAQELNKDHFVKRGSVKGLSLPMAALALFTLQTNSPAGGVGFRTSLRGGGPLTTLVVPDPTTDPESDSLWHQVWLNVLPQSELKDVIRDPKRDGPADRFPWLAPTRTSDPKAGGRDTTPLDAHPLQAYWGMPRRILLYLDQVKTGICDLSGVDGPCVTRYWTRNYGVNYTGAWEHPLAPYRRDKDGLPIALHPQPGGMGYRHWLGFVLGQGKDLAPARVVRWAWSREVGPQRFRIWAFGYDMDNMKARYWYESLMPAWHMEDEAASALGAVLQEVLEATRMVADNLRQALKSAWFRKGAPVSADLLSPIQSAFWQSTETEFFNLLQALYEAVTSGGEDIVLRQGWFQTIYRTSLQLFDHWAAAGDIADGDPKRIAVARSELGKFNHKKAIRHALRLDVKTAKKE